MAPTGNAVRLLRPIVALGALALALVAARAAFVPPYSILPWVAAALVPDGWRNAVDVVVGVLVALVFAAWCLPLLRGHARLPTGAYVLLGALAALVAGYFAVAWRHGVRYQGRGKVQAPAGAQRGRGAGTPGARVSQPPAARRAERLRLPLGATGVARHHRLPLARREDLRRATMTPRRGSRLHADAVNDCDPVPRRAHRPRPGRKPRPLRNGHVDPPAYTTVSNFSIDLLTPGPACETLAPLQADRVRPTVDSHLPSGRAFGRRRSPA
jgi:hypothetical protein